MSPSCSASVSCNLQNHYNHDVGSRQFLVLFVCFAGCGFWNTKIEFVDSTWVFGGDRRLTVSLTFVHPVCPHVFNQSLCRRTSVNSSGLLFGTFHVELTIVALKYVDFHISTFLSQ